MTEARYREWQDRLIVVDDEAFLPDEFDSIPHGTSSGYIHYGCRCADCESWYRTYYGRKPR